MCPESVDEAQVKPKFECATCGQEIPEGLGIVQVCEGIIADATFCKWRSSQPQYYHDYCFIWPPERPTEK